jgi:hypothetical protein
MLNCNQARYVFHTLGIGRSLFIGFLNGFLNFEFGPEMGLFLLDIDSSLMFFTLVAVAFDEWLLGMIEDSRLNKGRRDVFFVR